MDYDKFKKIIESCHLNFLIGSGASRNYLDTLGNVEDLMASLDSETSSFEKLIVDASIKRIYFEKCIKGNLGLLNRRAITNEPEFYLTKMNYIEFIVAINTILLKRKSNLVNKQVNIFTTNVDIFLDKTIEDLNVEYNDGFSGKLKPTFSTSNYRRSIYTRSPHYDNQAELPLFNLFKLHGSVTWKSETIDKITFDSNLSLIKNIAKLTIEGKLITNLKKKSENKTIEELLKEAKSLEYNDTFKNFTDLYDKIVMVNPTKEKFALTTLQYTFYELLRMYSNELEKENSILFVFGFSFADEHIREITKRVANSNPTLMIYVLAYDEEAKFSIDEKLILEEIKFRNIEVIIGGNLKDVTEKWFAKLAIELDKEYYERKKNDVIINLSLPKENIKEDGGN